MSVILSPVIVVMVTKIMLYNDPAKLVCFPEQVLISLHLGPTSFFKFQSSNTVFFLKMGTIRSRAAYDPGKVKVDYWCCSKIFKYELIYCFKGLRGFLCAVFWVHSFSLSFFTSDGIVRKRYKTKQSFRHCLKYF